MAADNSLGVVNIEISGDYSKLQSDFAAAQQQASRAGGQIAGALNSSFAPGVRAASGLVDQFGRSINSAGTVAATALPKIERGIVGIGNAAKDGAEKVQSFTGLIPGMGLAAERFINLVPGLGRAIMAAFPVLGAIAFAEGIARIIPQVIELANAFNPVAQATKRAEKAAKDYDETIQELGKHIRELDRDALEFALGKTAAGAAESANITQQFRAMQGMVTLEKERLRVAELAARAARADMSSTASFGEESGGGIVAAKAAALEVAEQNLKAVQKTLTTFQLEAAKLERESSKEGRVALKQGVDDRKKASDDAEKIGKDALRKEQQGWQNRADLFHEELEKTKSDRDAQLRELRTANEKEETEQKRFDEHMATQQQHWAKITIDAKDQRLKEAKVDTPVGGRVNASVAAALELQKAGIGTQQAMEGQVAEQQRLLNMAEYMKVPIGTQMAMKEHIMGMEIELGQVQGKNVSDQIIALTKLQSQHDRMDAKGARKGNLYAGLSNAAGAGSGILDKASLATVNLVSNGIEGISGALAQAALNGGKFGKVMAGIGRELAASALTSVLKIGLQSALKALLNLVPAFASVAAAQTAAAATAHAATSALNVGTVISYAAVGSAAAFASTSAIPIVGPILAPAVAAETFASISALAPLAAFQDGGRPERGKVALVGEKGPELFVPDSSGTIIPNHRLPGGAGLSLPTGTESSGGGNIHVGGIVVNGAQSPRETARHIASYLKSTSSKYQTRG